MPGETGSDNNPNTSSALSPEQLSALVQALVPELQKAISPGLNSAISSRLERFESKFQTPPSPAPAPDHAPVAPQAPGSNPQDNAILLQLKSLQEQLQQSQEREKAVARERAREQALSEVRQHLEAGKVRSEFTPAVLALLEQQGRIQFGEDGRATFTVEAPAFIGGPNEKLSVPLAEGVKAFLNEPVAKAFVAAPVPSQDVKPTINPLAVAERARLSQAQGRPFALSPTEARAVEADLTAKFAAASEG